MYRAMFVPCLGVYWWALRGQLGSRSVSSYRHSVKTAASLSIDSLTYAPVLPEVPTHDCLHNMALHLSPQTKASLELSALPDSWLDLECTEGCTPLHKARHTPRVKAWYIEGISA